MNNWLYVSMARLNNYLRLPLMMYFISTNKVSDPHKISISYWTASGWCIPYLDHGTGDVSKGDFIINHRRRTTRLRRMEMANSVNRLIASDQPFIFSWGYRYSYGHPSSRIDPVWIGEDQTYRPTGQPNRHWRSTMYIRIGVLAGYLSFAEEAIRKKEGRDRKGKLERRALSAVHLHNNEPTSLLGRQLRRTGRNQPKGSHG